MHEWLVKSKADQITRVFYESWDAPYVASGFGGVSIDLIYNCVFKDLLERIVHTIRSDGAAVGRGEHICIIGVLLVKGIV